MNSEVGLGADAPLEPENLDREKRRSLPRWLKYSVIVLIALGVFFRFYHLDKKVYWIDETNSSLRTLGYTKTELIETLFTGDVITAAQLHQFQQLSPERGWDDTWNALTGTAEHTPLYFLLARAWVGLVGHSVAAMRFLTALFSVLVLPCLYWLCYELFGAPIVGWIAMGLVAVTPVHVLYAQEARPYSLLSVLVLLSSEVLLRTLRTNTRRNWIAYGLTVAAGLYTQLLFGLVVMAQGLYVFLTEQWPMKRTYLIAAGASSLSLVPWLLILVRNWQKVQQSTISLNDGYSSSYIFDRWFLNLNLAFLSRELGGANILLVIITLIALYVFCRSAPKRAWLFVLLLIGVTFTVLAVPDLILGGRRSLRIRYLFPCFLGIQIAYAYVFATQAVWAKTWRQQLWRGFMVVLVAGGLAACMASSQAVVWWNKSVPRSSYYPPVAELINQAANPLVVSDGPVTDTLAFSAWLEPDVKLQLVATEPRKLKIAPGYDPVYLLNPSEQLQKILTRRGYKLSVAYEDRADPTEVENRLWLAKQ